MDTFDDHWNNVYNEELFSASEVGFFQNIKTSSERLVQLQASFKNETKRDSDYFKFHIDSQGFDFLLLVSWLRVVNDLPLFQIDQVYSLDEKCNLHLAETVKETYIYNTNYVSVSEASYGNSRSKTEEKKLQIPMNKFNFLTPEKFLNKLTNINIGGTLEMERYVSFDYPSVLYHISRTTPEEGVEYVFQSTVSVNGRKQSWFRKVSPRDQIDELIDEESKTVTQQISAEDWLNADLKKLENYQGDPIDLPFGVEQGPHLKLMVETIGTYEYSNAKAYFDLKESEGIAAARLKKLGISTYELKDTINPFPQKVGSVNDEVSPQNSQFLNKTPYIDPYDPEVVDMGNEIRTSGETRKDVILEMILKKINSVLTYDREMLELGSVGILSTAQILSLKKGVCQHYANIFTALSRNLHIPARIITGYYLDAGRVISHAWVEVLWNDSEWVPLEPQEQLLRPLHSGVYFPNSVNWNYEMSDGDKAFDKILKSSGNRFWQVKFSRVN